MLLLLGEAARTHDGVTIRGRGRSQSSAISDPRRQHFCRSNIRTTSHPCRSGEQALLSSCKERAYRCFHNGTHVVEGAYAISPLPWSRSPRRILGCAILIKPQPRHSVNTPPQKMCSPTNLPGHALHRLADRIKHAGHLPCAGEGGTASRNMRQLSLWARQLRSHRSQSPSGPCAEWSMQQPSSGCEGDDQGPDAHGRSAESPRWAWAGGGLGGGRGLGLRVRCV